MIDPIYSYIEKSNCPCSKQI